MNTGFGVGLEIIHTIRACRDARDDKFLELAVNGEASLIITGDADLLELDPFQGIRTAFLTGLIELRRCSSETR